MILAATGSNANVYESVVLPPALHLAENHPRHKQIAKEKKKKEREENNGGVS
jgi:hypothetical protein